MFVEINRLFSYEDIVEKYGGSPQLWESLRPYLPVWQHHDGKPIYLESQVDEFLRALQHRWSIPSSRATTSPATKQTFTDEYLTVAQAQQRFLGGKMSKEWWYGQIRDKKLPSHKAGGSILLKPTDIDQFIIGMQSDDEGRAQPALNTPPELPPVPDTAQKSSTRRRAAAGKASGFRFFGG